ncbi:MAG: hypothetical protein LBS25_03830 [Candidatus Symbiothrix sp.]|jgi:hypothetical protein|nr:hypothetical protein [Candidatus Symbiothrix sp.]
MKKQTIILTTAILLAASASADCRTIKDRTDNWLQRENTDNKGSQSLVANETTSGNLRGAIDDTGDSAIGALSVPVGAIPLAAVLLLGCAYGIFRRTNKQ